MKKRRKKDEKNIEKKIKRRRGSSKNVRYRNDIKEEYISGKKEV